MSANDLALYMESSETARIGIIQRALEQPAYTVIRYRDARDAIRAFLADPARNIKPLVIAEQALSHRSGDQSGSALRQEDARLSIEVLHAMQGMQNSVAPYSFTLAPARQKKLWIAGVEVSVHADLMVQGLGRDADKVGAAMLRMTKDDASSSIAKERRKRMGLYVATLVSMHVGHNISTTRQLSNKLCMSIDVQHGQVFTAPPSNTRRVNDLTNACRFIASLWGRV